MLLLFDNQADGAILSGPPSLLPLSNMQNQQLEYVWRSADTAPENTTFNVNLPDVIPLRAVILARTNATTACRIRYQAFRDPERTDLAYDSGWLQFAARATWGTIPWGAKNWYTGFVEQEDPDRAPDLVHILPQTGVSQRYWRVEVDDDGNDDGFFEASRLLMCRAFEPSINMSFGSNGFSFEDRSIRQQKLNGGEIRRRRVNPRVASFGIDYLPDDEAFDEWYFAWMRSGFTGEVYYIPNAGLTGLQLQREAFLATISQADPIVRNTFGRASIGATVKEII